jgi:putative ABC transport system permease protein
VRAALVVAEVALSLALLAGAGLLVRSFDRLLSVSPGFRPEGVLTMELSLSGSRYRADEARIGFFEELTARLERLPGIVAAGGISALPLAGLGSATSFTIVGQPEPPPGERPVADVRAVTGDYFRALGIPLVAGRAFTGRERGDAAHVIVINESMARRFWPGEDPIGRKVAISWTDGVVDEVVGVVADVKLSALDGDARATAYWPHAREDVTSSGLTLAIRTDGDPAGLAPAVVAQVRDLEPLQPVANIRTMEDVVAGSVAPRRVVMLLVAVFAAVAMTLAAVGLYGVIAAIVSGRTREIGVRLAIGARPADVLRQVVGQAMRLVAVGIAVGLAGALALTRLMASQLFGVAPTDPVTFGAVIVLLAAVGLVASLVPALRAARVDPVGALRAE